MSESNGSGQAFPCPEAIYASDAGLTKRELFAAMAMQGLLADKEWDDAGETTAECAVHLADALLRALSTEPKR